MMHFKFKPHNNVVDNDENHFYLTHEKKTYDIAPGEVEPLRECQCKRFIPKIMFMCVVVKSMFSSNGNVFFEGKIGIWPFITRELAKKSSKHIKKGRVETKPVQFITKEHMRAMLINNVIPTIRLEWPKGLSNNIFIQKHNVKPHIAHNNREFIEESNKRWFQYSICTTTTKFT